MSRSYRQRGTGNITGKGYIRTQLNHIEKYEHVFIVEKILGKPLPKAARIHHVDGNPRNNKPQNLVVCPDNAYHNLIHMRQRALEKTGNPNYLRCRYCKQYDDPENIVWYEKKATGQHKKCASEYNKKLRER